MEAIPTAITEKLAEEIEELLPEPAAKTTAQKMFRHSDFLDVGEGALECEHARDGECEDTEHFHAWCRLANPYQHEDIRSKGMAAKARKIRELRDPESDASIVLDEFLRQIDDPAFAEQIIDEMVAREWAQDYLEAQEEVDAREEYAEIVQDREELTRLAETRASLPTDEQAEEYKQLTKHVGQYLDDLRKRLEEIQEPKREELRQRTHEQLVALIRVKRVEEEADRAFLDTYNSWTWFVGTFRPKLHESTGRPYLPMWADIGSKDRAAAGTMYGEAPEVITALKGLFNDLQIAMQRASAGN